jgi:hypothetical protein
MSGVVIANVWDSEFWGMVTCAGTLAKPGAPQMSSTTTRPSKDGRFKVTVPVELSPHTTVSGDDVTLATVGGTTSAEMVRVLPA